jgi:SAM-dependent methyltransferase
MKTVTDWANLEGEEAHAASTGGLMTLRKWYDEPRAIMDLISVYVSEGRRVADLGCGVGRVSQPLSTRFHVISIDRNINMPQACTTPLEVLPYGTPFDVTAVLSCYVMQHIPPENFPAHLQLLQESHWAYLFLLESESPSDFPNFNFRNSFESWATANNVTLISKRDWEFEPHVSVCVYKRSRHASHIPLES